VFIVLDAVSETNSNNILSHFLFPSSTRILRAERCRLKIQSFFFGDLIPSIVWKGSFLGCVKDCQYGSQPVWVRVEMYWMWMVKCDQMENCLVCNVCYCVTQVDPKFLRNMRFAKKHNVKHQKQQKVWADCTVLMTVYSDTDKCVLWFFYDKWMSCTFYASCILPAQYCGSMVLATV